MMDLKEKALKLHKDSGGKIGVVSKVSIKNKEELSLAYTPGVAEVCKEIYLNKDNSYLYTNKRNTVAIISDGTAVLGLGDIGPFAAMPVMEGKAAIFKEFAGIDAIPIVLDTTDPDMIIEVIRSIAPSFGGINLEDIKAPKCFYIEKRLKELLDIPVFHDDQHGTAVVVGAALINALKLTNRTIEKTKIVVNGAGSAGVAIVKFLINLGAKDITVCDINGILNFNYPNINDAQKELVELTNKNNKQGLLEDALIGSDCFIGVSAGNILTKEMLLKMNKDFICFPLANPVPEVTPEVAYSAGAKVVGTGSSSLPNQINNALVFPGLFKGILQHRGVQFDYEMLTNAAKALASVVKDEEITTNYIIPSVFNEEVVKSVSEAVSNVINKRK